MAGFWLLDEVEFGVNFHLAEAVRRTLLVVSLVGDPRLTPQTPYAFWFTRSVYLLTFAAVVYAGLALFRPVVYRLRTLPQERLRAARILACHGRSSLDFFKLWPDKSYYFDGTRSCFIAYRVAGGCALALADPVGPEGGVEATVGGFLEFCRSRGWGVAFHQVLPDFLPVYERLGLRRLKIGDEATVDLKGFSLEGARRKKLRGAVRKFEEKGFRVVEYEPPVPERLLRQLREVSDAVRGGQGDGRGLLPRRLRPPHGAAVGDRLLGARPKRPDALRGAVRTREESLNISAEVTPGARAGA